MAKKENKAIFGITSDGNRFNFYKLDNESMVSSMPLVYNNLLIDYLIVAFQRDLLMGGGFSIHHDLY